MHTVLFDIDGTLLRSGGAGKAAFEAALRAEFALTAIRHDVPYAGRTDRAIGKDLLEAHDVEASPENWQRLLRRYLANLPIYLDSHRGSLLPGIAEVLGALCGRPDVAVGLLTGNVRAGAKAKLGHFGLYEHFAFGGFGDHHYCRDEVAREALAAVHEHLNGEVRLDRLWVVGDTPLDIRCARAIGAKVVAVATGSHSYSELEQHQPDLLLENLGDPSPLLRLCK